jgi:acetoacetate decarboxylase
VPPLQGYSLPRTPEGRSSLVPAPPWHYAGELLVLEYWADAAAVAAVLPPGLQPYLEDPGRAAALFVDWQWCTDGRDELDDPVRGQYREFFVVVNAMLDGELVTTCPYIWVDKDVALARGWIQGFPKKLGRIELTRSFALTSPAAPPDGPGGRFAGTLTANERRLAWGAVTLERESETGPTHNDPPMVNVRHFPRLEAGRRDDPAVHELVRARSRDRSLSRIWEGNAELELYDAPHEELSALAPVRMGRGFRFSFAYTIDDLETVARL